MWTSGFTAYDIYGTGSRQANMEIEEPVTQVSSGKLSLNAPGATVSVIGIIIALVSLRVVYELAD